jgi:hypothetical protein
MAGFGGLTTVPLRVSWGLTTVPMAGFGDLTTVPLGVGRGLTTVPMSSSVLRRIDCGSPSARRPVWPVIANTKGQEPRGVATHSAIGQNRLFLGVRVS